MNVILYIEQYIFTIFTILYCTLIVALTINILTTKEAQSSETESLTIYQSHRIRNINEYIDPSIYATLGESSINKQIDIGDVVALKSIGFGIVTSIDRDKHVCIAFFDGWETVTSINDNLRVNINPNETLHLTQLCSIYTQNIITEQYIAKNKVSSNCRW